MEDIKMNKREIVKHIALAYLTTQKYDPKEYHPSYTSMKFYYNTLTHQFDEFKIYDDELIDLIYMNSCYDIIKDKYIVDYKALYKSIVQLLSVKGYK